MGEVVVCQQTQDLTNHWRPYSPPRRPITFVIRGFTFVILLSLCVFLLFPLGARRRHLTNPAIQSVLPRNPSNKVVDGRAEPGGATSVRERRLSPNHGRDDARARASIAHLIEQPMPSTNGLWALRRNWRADLRLFR